MRSWLQSKGVMVVGFMASHSKYMTPGHLTPLLQEQNKVNIKQDLEMNQSPVQSPLF